MTEIDFHPAPPETFNFQETYMEGVKHDSGKPPMALLSGSALLEIARVLDFGQGKYNTWNWKGGMAWSRVAGAVLRHIFAWLGGQDKDPETGLSHLAHAACGLMFLLDFEVNNLGSDDRFKPGKVVAGIKVENVRAVQG